MRINKAYLGVMVVVGVLIHGVLSYMMGFDCLKDKGGMLVFLAVMNGVMFGLFLLAYYLHYKAIGAKSHFEFMSKTMLLTGIKMVVIIAFILGYYFVTQKSLSMGGVLGTFGLYFIYSFIELYFLLKTVQKNKIGKENV